MAHEFRNPLTTALWCAELLGRIPAAERGGARGDKLVAMALRSLRRVSAIVEDHLLAERLAAGGIPQKPEPVALAEALEAAAERAAVAVPAAELPEGARVEADRGLLVQVLTALLAAVAGEGASPRARARLEAGAVRLELSGAPVAEGALALPEKGSAAGGQARPLGLVMAVAAARAMGLSLRVEDASLVLGFPAPER